MSFRLLLTACIVLNSFGAMAGSVVESARDIPVVYTVDVAVAGGSLGAASAAITAARNGASVFLAAPRTYLGDDVVGLREPWLVGNETPDSELGSALLEAPRIAMPLNITDGFSFTYKANQPSAERHEDNDPPSLLADRLPGTALSKSVEYAQDTTLEIDLGKVETIRRVHLLCFQRPGDFEVGQIEVKASADKVVWTPVARARNPKPGLAGYEDAAIQIMTELATDARYLEVAVLRADGAKRILLGEIIVEPANRPAVDENAAVSSVASTPSPMQVKRVLDMALIKEGVRYLYSSYVSDVLQDASGRPAGFVIVNRAGRQAVLAKVIIDATDNAWVARMAGAKFRHDAESRTLRFTTIGGTRPASDSGRALSDKILVDPSAWGEAAWKTAFEYTLDIPASYDWRTLAAAEQKLRDLSWTQDQVLASETPFGVPADRLKSHATSDKAWVDSYDAFRPEKVERMYVLGGCADVTRADAAEILRPMRIIQIGMRVGVEAAMESKATTVQGGVRLNPAAPETPGNLEVKENLTGPRPFAEGLPVILSGACSLPVWGEYDVVVVGGGTAGAPAALAAARQGARTLLVEYQHGLGGVGTLGLIGNYYYGNRVGFTGEVDRAMAAMDGNEKVKSSWNVEWKMEWYRRELRKAGAEIWFGGIGSGVVTDGRTVKGVVVATPEGRGAVMAHTVIDATGNADIAAMAGAKCITTGPDSPSVQGTGMPPRKPGAHYTNTDYTFTQDSDMLDVWRTLIGGRVKYKDVYDAGVIVDSRERRHVIGEFSVSPMDIWNMRTYPDSIALAASNFDSHGFTVHTLFALQQPDKKEVKGFVPYRCLLPKGLKGLLVTGIAISAHRDAQPILRMQPDVQNVGYAAGVAAAMAAANECDVHKVDIRALQRHLIEKGNVPETVLTDRDSYPYSGKALRAAVESLANDDKYEGASILLTQPRRAVRMLRHAYRKTDKPEAKLAYAHTLGLLCDRTGAEALVNVLKQRSWDKGWAFTGMGQYGPSLSRVDTMLVALARTRDGRAPEIIVQKASTLTAESEFSHHRAIAIASETTGSPACAAAIAALLCKENMQGWAVTDIGKACEASKLANPNIDRERSMRELILARALYRCGDKDGLGKQILTAYAGDFRGHFAMHARAVLAGERTDYCEEQGIPLEVETTAALAK